MKWEKVTTLQRLAEIPSRELGWLDRIKWSLKIHKVKNYECGVCQLNSDERACLTEQKGKEAPQRLPVDGVSSFSETTTRTDSGDISTNKEWFSGTLEILRTGAGAYKVRLPSVREETTAVRASSLPWSHGRPEDLGDVTVDIFFRLLEGGRSGRWMGVTKSLLFLPAVDIVPCKTVNGNEGRASLPVIRVKMRRRYRTGQHQSVCEEVVSLKGRYHALLFTWLGTIAYAKAGGATSP